MNIDLALVESIIFQLPNYVFVKDINCVYRLCNLNFAKIAGLKHAADIIGKTDYDMPWGQYTARLYQQEDQAILKTGATMPNREVKMITLEGERILSVSKAPLHSQNGAVIGVLGIYIDITPQKEAEHLKFENEAHKVQLEEQTKFRKNLDQFVHDIQSPVTGAVMMVNKCSELPEEKRVPLRVALMQIQDMSMNLLSKYNQPEDQSFLEQRRAVLVSATLSEVLIQKKYQYEEASIRFEYHCHDPFAFINIEPNALKSVISNLINNAVEAFYHNVGQVTLLLEATREWVKIKIQDNGRGMAPDLVKKIMGNLSVTAGKAGGHGIGLTQVRETLQRNQGELMIDSKKGEGTLIILTFPRITPPSWIAEEIKLGPEDIVVILDDENSIKEAWKAHFAPTLKEAPYIKMHYFKQGQKALEFMRTRSLLEQQRLFLLTDFELLNQPFNGLDIVEQSQVGRSILATSHYDNSIIRDRAAKLGVKILPKQLAVDVAIKIDESIGYKISENNDLKKVDLILVDDNKMFIDSLMMAFFYDKKVDFYEDPRHFLGSISKYPKDTPICLDNHFDGGGMTGVEVAAQLHDQGYTSLYLLSGDRLSEVSIPHYLTVIQKSNMNEISKMLKTPQ